MVIGDRLKELHPRIKGTLRKAMLRKRTGLLRCYISLVENGHTVRKLRLSKGWHAPLRCRCTSSFMKAKLPCQFARRNVPRAVRSGEARATMPTTCPSCADYLRRWGLASKNFCSTWPKKSRSGANLTASQRRVLARAITSKRRQEKQKLRAHQPLSFCALFKLD